MLKQTAFYMYREHTCNGEHELMFKREFGSVFFKVQPGSHLNSCEDPCGRPHGEEHKTWI